MFEKVNYHHFCPECLEINHSCFAVEKSGGFMEFINENVLGFLFLIWLLVAIVRIIHNFTMRIRYRAGNSKYEIKRDENEGKESERHSIYIVCKEKNCNGKKTYHHVNTYTYETLGYLRPPRDKDLFNSKDGDYVNGKNVIIYNIIEILKLANVKL